MAVVAVSGLILMHAIILLTTWCTCKIMANFSSSTVALQDILFDYETDDELLN